MRAGDHVDLTIEKPAAGGRMIARHDGQVVLVLGAIPGERVRARIEKADKRIVFASTIDVLEASPDRRPAPADPLCGGSSYAHIAYDRQTRLKAEVIADAFRRLGRLPIESQIPVASSPDAGYRMRARLHVRGTRAGFYREASHELCDAAATRQLSGAAVDAVHAAVASLANDHAAVVSIEISENVAGDERAIHVDTAFGAELSQPALARAVSAASLRGCTARTPGGVLMTAGDPTVSDPFSTLTTGRASAGDLRRHAESFFQANRFLLPSLVTTVLEAVPADGDVLDLYAGVGLFGLSLAACGRQGITAVEGNSSSGADLRRNAAAFPGAVRVEVASVEDFVRRTRQQPRTVIVDPPRTGMSKDALEAIARLGAAGIVYVSCDAPTMARDARRLIDAGYAIESLQAFDLFPNTPHVETIGVFVRSRERR